MSAPELISLQLEEIKANKPSQIITEVRQKWSKACGALDNLFWQEYNISDLLYLRTRCLDELLLYAWQKYELTFHDVTLMAVGGYGQMRLHPGSDADIFILIPPKSDTLLNHKIEQFVAFCWDCGIKLGLSVRTLQECLAYAQDDLSIYTTLLTARMLAGSSDFNELKKAMTELWTFEAFFADKCKERGSRLLRTDQTEYLLEPNIKESLGGLRDISLISWLAIKKYKCNDLMSLVENQDINDSEYEALNKSNQFLLKIRYALHLISAKSTDRLYFEYQEILAEKFGYRAKTLNKTLSLFMQTYFRTITNVRNITDLLCQHYQEEILPETAADFIKISDNAALQSPEYLLSFFLLIAQNKAQGFCASSSRLINKVLNTYPEDHFNNSRCHEIFNKILKSPHCANTITLMHRFGILSKYIPAFALIAGQMQYDLFHNYTVDAHTLLLVQNIQYFYQHELYDKFAYLSECKSKATRVDLLYLSGLFHDIGKGQGGDHSKIGSQLAWQFCNLHSLPDEDADLVSWLVNNHLLMSITAQRKDICDDKIIATFANAVKTPHRLCYLYLLTVADIVATNPTLWNHWRAALLQDLYLATKRKLMSPLETKESTSIENSKQKILAMGRFENSAYEKLWEHFDNEYFKNEAPSNIAWQTSEILNSDFEHKTFTIAIRAHHNQVGTEIFIYAKDHVNLFASICATMEKVFLNIVQARINTTRHHYSLQSFIVLDISGTPITGPQRLAEIRHSLEMLLQQQGELKIPFVSRHVPRNLKFFSVNTKIKISSPKSQDKTIIKMDAPDFPGLLARIGEVFVKNDIILHSAKINTLGHKVEDVFYISDSQTQLAITDPLRIQQIKASLLEAVSKHSK